MILGFKPEFVPKILSSSKIHTIRPDKNQRWKAGMKIHFATGVRTKNYKQFLLRRCYSVQDISMDFMADPNRITVDGKDLSYLQLLRLIKNDGFNRYMEFWNFFSKKGKLDKFSGVIIHWTRFKYHVFIDSGLSYPIDKPEGYSDHALDALNYIQGLPKKVEIVKGFWKKIWIWIRSKFKKRKTNEKLS